MPLVPFRNILKLNGFTIIVRKLNELGWQVTDKYDSLIFETVAQSHHVFSHLSHPGVLSFALLIIKWDSEWESGLQSEGCALRSQRSAAHVHSFLQFGKLCKQ
jgi:hypothetical protein